jgi:hypothetical protein
MSEGSNTGGTSTIQWCDKCGKYGAIDKLCTCQKPLQQVFPNYGWICPKCDAGVAPHTSCCPNCTPFNYKVT